MSTNAVFWMCAAAFVLGYCAGETVRLVQEIRRYRKARRDSNSGR
jgi:hypothetical protein